MKTVKIKVSISDEQQKLLEGYLKELEWIWNRARRTALHNHCLDWYVWAQKQSSSKKLYPEFSLEDIVRVPLRFAKGAAWNNASCQIAVGGRYFVNDPDAPPIKYLEKKGKERIRERSKPWESSGIRHFSNQIAIWIPLRKSIFPSPIEYFGTNLK